MADIVGNIQKINDIEVSADAPISESLVTKIGANINALIDIVGGPRVAEFTSSGTWTAPAHVNRVILIGVGGGGGGASSPRRGSMQWHVAEGGRAGVFGIKVVSVTPGQTYAVTIGAGGAGGGFNGDNGAPGGAGGNTEFGSLATFAGGAGGRTYFSYNIGDDAINYALGEGRASAIGRPSLVGHFQEGHVPAGAPQAGEANTGSGGAGGNGYQSDRHPGAPGGSGYLAVIYSAKE